jgi:hypothetical protein
MADREGRTVTQPSGAERDAGKLEAAWEWSSAKGGGIARQYEGDDSQPMWKTAGAKGKWQRDGNEGIISAEHGQDCEHKSPALSTTEQREG